jgi:hypothetical protein
MSKGIYLWYIPDILIFKMRKFLMSLSAGLYKKIDDYKKENEFPSILATIRFILNQFFKK